MISSGTKKISETNTKILPWKYIKLHERFGVILCVCIIYLKVEHIDFDVFSVLKT